MVTRCPQWTRRRGGAKVQRRRQFTCQWNWCRSKPRSAPKTKGANACLMGGIRGWRTLAHVEVAHPAGKQSGEGRQLPNDSDACTAMLGGGSDRHCDGGS
eukprot:7387787-Prymnesium_polylepis.2